MQRKTKTGVKIRETKSKTIFGRRRRSFRGETEGSVDEQVNTIPGNSMSVSLFDYSAMGECASGETQVASKKEKTLHQKPLLDRG